MVPTITKKRSVGVISDPIESNIAGSVQKHFDQFVVVEKESPSVSRTASESSCSSLSSNCLYTSTDAGKLHKRHKRNSYSVKPELITSYEARFCDLTDDGNNSTSQKSFDQLIRFFKEKEFSLQMEMLPENSAGRYSQTINLEQEFLLNTNEHGLIHHCFNGPLLLIFFGAMNETHLHALNNCYEELFKRYGLQIVGITSHADANFLKFPIFSDNKGYLARFFEILDPLGGGVYPLDKMILIDTKGVARAEFSIYNPVLKCGRGVNSIQSGSSMCKMLTNETCIIHLVECLEYLKTFKSL